MNLPSLCLSHSLLCACMRTCFGACVCGTDGRAQLVDMLKQDAAVIGCYTTSASKQYTTISNKSFHFATRMENSNSEASCYLVLQYCHLLSQYCSHNSSVLHHSECLFLCMLSAVSDFLMADLREQPISIQILLPVQEDCIRITSSAQNSFS